MDTIIADSTLKIQPTLNIIDEFNFVHSKATNTLKLELPDSLNEKFYEALIEYSQKNDGISEDTIFTVIATIGIFIFGIIVDRAIKWWNVKGDQRKLRLYFKHFVDHIIDRASPKMEEAYRKFYQNTSVDSGIPITAPRLLTSNFQRINTLQDKDVFYAIKNEEALSELRSNLDFLEGMILAVDEYHTFVRSESDSMRLNLQSLVNSFIFYLVDYGEYLKKDNPDFEHRAELEELANSSVLRFHSEQGIQKSVTKVYKFIVRPLQLFIVNNNIYRANPESMKIIETGKEIGMKYRELKDLTIQIRLEYRKFAFAVKITHGKLISARSKIDWR